MITTLHVRLTEIANPFRKYSARVLSHCAPSNGTILSHEISSPFSFDVVGPLSDCLIPPRVAGEKEIMHMSPSCRDAYAAFSSFLGTPRARFKARLLTVSRIRIALIGRPARCTIIEALTFVTPGQIQAAFKAVQEDASVQFVFRLDEGMSRVPAMCQPMIDVTRQLLQEPGGQLSCL